MCHIEHCGNAASVDKKKSKIKSKESIFISVYFRPTTNLAMAKIKEQNKRS
jgi:hypothetical protein